MSIASVGTLGAAATGSAATTRVLTTSATAEAGNLVVVMVGKNNTGGTSGGSNEITGLADSAGNTWSKMGEHTYSDGAADDGATVALFYSLLTSEIASGGTITASFSASSNNRLIAAWEFTCSSAIYQRGTQTTGVGNSADPGSLAASGLASVEYLAVRTVCMETNQTLTVTGGYTEFTGAGIAAQGLRGEFLIATAASFTSAPTMSGASDSASVFTVLSESIPGQGGLLMCGTF